MEAIKIANTILKIMWDNTIDVTPLKLQSLLYYTQGFCLQYDCDIKIDEDFKKWDHGPIIENIYNIFKIYKYKNIQFLEKGKLNYIDTVSPIKNPEFLIILDHVIGSYGNIETRLLLSMIHLHTSLVNTEKNQIIDKKKIRKTFRELKYGE